MISLRVYFTIRFFASVAFLTMLLLPSLGSSWTLDFMIIGERKCGTTTLYKNLVKHPEIMSPRKKELFFFSDNEAYLNDPFLDNYRSNFQWRVSGHKKLFESTVLYLYHPLVPERVYRHFPNIKLIILLRDPVERIFSSYKYNLKRKLEDRTFEQFIDDELASFPQKFKNPSIHIGREDDPLCRGLYEYSIRRWRHHFPKEQFLILSLKEFAEDPQDLFQAVFDFIEVSPHEFENFRIYNVSDSEEQVDPKTRKKLEDFYLPYNDRLKEYLKSEFNIEMSFY